MISQLKHRVLFILVLLECIEIYPELFVIIIYLLPGDFICVKLLICTKL